MTGLETILSTIEQDAREAAKQVTDAARQEADKLLEQARLDAERHAASVAESGKAKAQELIARAESAAQLAQRRTLLTSKQELIRSVIAEAKDALTGLPAEEYFEVLLKLAEKYVSAADGVLQLSARDLKRLPASFGKDLECRTGKKLTISSEPAPISGGFLLQYNGIDINCSFDALFEDSAEVLQDKVNAILFA